jgi:DNA-binding GntR family transcriptional regulator
MSKTDWTSELREFGAISPRKSMADEAADTLREFILLGKLEAGMPVPERDLAAALGVSRTPLKEALRILEMEGLVVYSATRRPSVADPTLEELEENLAVIGVLEALAGELACARATDDEIAHLSSLNDRMLKASPETDPLEFFRWDMEFHQSIVHAARNAPLLESHNRFNARLWRARFISSKLRNRRESTLGQHEDIVAALQRRDTANAALHLRVHLETTVKNIAYAQDILKRDTKTDET